MADAMAIYWVKSTQLQYWLNIKIGCSDPLNIEAYAHIATNKPNEHVILA